MDLGLKGRRAIVSAASKGLGRACAMSLAGEGVDTLLYLAFGLVVERPLVGERPLRGPVPVDRQSQQHAVRVELRPRDRLRDRTRGRLGGRDRRRYSDRDQRHRGWGNVEVEQLHRRGLVPEAPRCPGGAGGDIRRRPGFDRVWLKGRTD